MNDRTSDIIREMKLKKFEEQKGICPSCSSRLPAGAQLAHKINQGKKGFRGNIRNLEREYSAEYGRGIGKKIIHHPLNMALTCPEQCNKAVLVDNLPIEKAELIAEILKHFPRVDREGTNG